MIILTGVAGSGKSVQGRLLADEYGYAWISTGEILRVLVTGKRRQQMLKGKLLNDWEVIDVMDKVIELVDARDEIVLDGFPRTIVQSDWLLSQANKNRFSITAVFHLKASEDDMRKRLISRGRQDDNDTSISKRFEEYKSVTLPIIDHLKEEGIPVYEIEASNNIEAIHQKIINQLKSN